MIRSLVIGLAVSGTVLSADAASAERVLVAAGEPEVFSTGGLDADRARSVDENRVHVVYATATWCPPCKKMKTTTWVDEDVVGWLGANAVVTPLDVDEFRADAQRLRVRAMPTIMVFNGSTEVARTVGYQEPAAFRQWLESSTGRGMPSGDASAGEAPVSQATVQEKLALAQEAMNAGRLDEATEAYVWLWDAMRQDRAANELRRGQLSAQIESLLAEHEPAREVFAERRDAIGMSMPAIDADDETMLDWIVLNRVIGEGYVSLGWIDRSIEEQHTVLFLRKHQQMLRPMLTEAGMWDEAAVVVNNPFSSARVAIMDFKKSQRGSGATGIDAATLGTLADLYAIALTSDRGGMAERVSSLILRTEDTPAVRRALVARAIDADVTKPALAELIAGDDSDAAAALRSRLDR
ncbi:MAG: thioredoxin fold domain-containing protein [Planctomycetota bacterium]